MVSLGKILNSHQVLNLLQITMTPQTREVRCLEFHGSVHQNVGKSLKFLLMVFNHLTSIKVSLETAIF